MIVKNSLAIEMNYSFRKPKTISLSLYFGRDCIQIVVYSSSGKWNTRERTYCTLHMFSLQCCKKYV